MQQATKKLNAFGNLVLEQVWSRLGKNYRDFCNEYYQLSYTLSECMSNYYPFGSSLPTRFWSHVSRAYRYGFNSKEKDFETVSDAYDFGARIYDGRLGRWMGVDPQYYRNFDLSPYGAMGNCPILFVDIFGEILIIKSLIATYTYKDGALYNENGSAVTEDQLKADTYASEVLKQISQIELTATGKNLVFSLYNSTKYTTTITNLEESGDNSVNSCVGQDKAPFNIIYFDPFTQVGLPIQNEMCYEDPIYFVLAHELQHAKDYNEGTNNNYCWYYTIDGKAVSKREILACHIENKIRAEAGAPLRTHYGLITEQDPLDNEKEIETPDEQSRLITNSGKSNYHTQTGARTEKLNNPERDGYDYAKNR